MSTQQPGEARPHVVERREQKEHPEDAVGQMDPEHLSGSNSGSSSIRLRRVLELRQALADGRYQVNAEQVAEALFRHARQSTVNLPM